MKIFLSDFDGTLVNKDMLDVLCGITGHEDDSKNLNEEFIQGKREGLPVLKERIDFLKGVTIEQVFMKLDENDYLIEGAIELFQELKKRNVITVLHSGNLIPVLQYYQKKLGIDYIIGNTPRMTNNVIIKKIGAEKKDIIAIGDSPSDLAVFSLASKKIVINAKEGIEKQADIIINDNLNDLIPMLDEILR